MKSLLAILVLSGSLFSQVYSPTVLLRNQPDATNLRRFARAITDNADARSPHERAVAIWRYFLTDGRFVKPGFWYHIAGWTYEEPSGEVLDPLKLLNSYGFGLCYHIAPLLEAVFEAAGFADARVWFLTGHTVAEVFYDGAYHHFDSDMMGYNVAGTGPFQGKPVVSVFDLEKDPSIITGKMTGPTSVRQGTVDEPWYPADVRARAIGGLAQLFATANDNYLFPYSRYSPGHDMSYVLRPGEKLVRYFQPETPSLYYLPYVFDGKTWREFPQESERYGIRTSDGPRSQKDARTWATGRIEYTPPSIGQSRDLEFDMPSPWVIIDAQFLLDVRLRSAESSLIVETSTVRGEWTKAGELTGPYDGRWTAEPHAIVETRNGKHTAVSGTYGYRVRIRRLGSEPSDIRSLTLTSRIQLNPRTLPELTAGANDLVYNSGPAMVRDGITLPLESLAAAGLRVVNEAGQSLLCPTDAAAEKVIELPASAGFDFGARFIEIRDRLAPEKRTAETRLTGAGNRSGAASIEWSVSPTGPWRTAWSFPSKETKEPTDRALRWPEAFVSIRDLPAGTARVFVRIRTSGPCIDSVRAASWRKGEAPAGRLRITHAWTENGAPREHVEVVSGSTQTYSYRVHAGPNPRNESITLESVEQAIP